MNKRLKTNLLFLSVLLFIFVFSFLIVSAEPNLKYEPMETIPGFDKTADFAIFISNLYKFGIWTVGICALIMIAIGGYMYAASGGNNASMEKAKGFITDALVGLILALLAYLILYIINPELVKIKMAAAVPPVAPPTIPGPPPSLPPAAPGACQKMKSQVPSQCKDTSAKLNSMLNCINEKLGNTVQISSISDENGGVTCWKDHPGWPKCNSDKTKGPVIVKDCCWHAKNSCHYGGTTGGNSCAVDFSDKGSSTSNEEIKTTALNCGAGYADNEGNHVHASVPGCGCDT